MTPASPAPRPAGFQPVSLNQGLATAPGCAETAPLFRSNMPSRIAYSPVAEQRTGEQREAARGQAEAEAEEPPAPAMHQALHLCVVERFDPRKPFSGARSAVYHL